MKVERKKMYLPVRKEGDAFKYLLEWDNAALINAALMYIYEALDLTSYYDWRSDKQHISAILYKEYSDNDRILNSLKIGEFTIERYLFEIINIKKSLITTKFNTLYPSEIKDIVSQCFFNLTGFSAHETFCEDLLFTCSDLTFGFDSKIKLLKFSVKKQVKLLAGGAK